MTWLVVEMVCSMPASPGEELAARSGVVGVAAVPGVGGGDTELSSASPHCSSRGGKCWLVFTTLTPSSIRTVNYQFSRFCRLTCS